MPTTKKLIESPLPPAVSVEECTLLAVLRAQIRLAMLSGESLASIGTRTGLSLGTLRKWTYQATTGDALALENAIREMGGADIIIV